MAQLKVKQISDFVTAVGTIHNGVVGTGTATAISDAKSLAISTAASADVVVLSSAKSYADVAESDAITSAVSQAEAKDVARATTTATNLSNAIAKEVIDRNTAIGVVNTRVTTLLAGSTEALDTFGEIKGFIDGLASADVTTIAAISTAVSNDVVHSTAISTGISVAIANDLLAQGYADAAESDAIIEAGRLDAIVLSSAKSYADAAESDANTEAGRLDAIVLSSAKSYADVAESDAITSAVSQAEAKDVARATTTATNLSNAISTEVINRNAAILVLDNDLQGQIDALSGVNSDEVIALFVDNRSFDAGKVFNLNGGHVAVFVNGLQIHEAGEGVDGWSSENGQLFTVAGLGYDLESDDHIVVSGTLA